MDYAINTAQACLYLLPFLCDWAACGHHVSLTCRQRLVTAGRSLINSTPSQRPAFLSPFCHSKQVNDTTCPTLTPYLL